MKSSPTCLWMSLGALVCLWSSAARAQTCTESSDCPKSFTCQAFESGACPASAPCEAGKECPAPPPCEVVTSHACVPGACATDADCADFMVCHASTISTCAAPVAQPAIDCPPNQVCTSPTPALDAGSCSETTSKTCVPRYELPCQKDADCGDGFSCVAGQECSCSASAGKAAAPVPAVDGGSADAFAPPVEPKPVDGGTSSCECHPTETKSCQAKQIDCKSDADCPSTFLCQTYGGGSATCMVSPDGGACVERKVESFSYQRCTPRYYGGTLGGVAKDGSAQSTAGGLPVPGTTTRPVAPAEGGPTSDAGVAVESDAGAAPGSSGACSVRAAGASTSSAAAGHALGLVLLALGLRRRRQH